MRKTIKVILIVVALIVAFIIGINLYSYGKKRVEVKSMPDYYQTLAEQCLQKSSYGCCMASVRAMKNGNYKLSENNTCGDGFAPNMMRCIDSFKWCEPVKR